MLTWLLRCGIQVNGNKMQENPLVFHKIREYEVKNEAENFFLQNLALIKRYSFSTDFQPCFLLFVQMR